MYICSDILKKILDRIAGCSNVGEGCWRKMAVLMLVKDVGEKCMLVKTYIFLRGYFSPTYIKLFNMLHQHTFNFLFKFFTNTQFFSPTYRKLFANILHQHTYEFLSSPTDLTAQYVPCKYGSEGVATVTMLMVPVSPPGPAP